MMLQFFLAALSIIILFRLFYLFNRKLTYSSGLKQKINYALPILELFSWIGFVTWFAKNIYYSGNYMALITFGATLILLIVPAFFIIRDFLSGVYLKLQNKITEGSSIEFEGINGKIEKTGNFGMEIIDDQGNVRNIPYNKIRSKIITRQGFNPNLERICLVFQFSEKTDINYVVPELKKQLLNTPWVAVSQPVIIEKVKLENGKYTISAQLYTLSRNYTEYIREKVEKNMTDNLL